MSVGVIWQWLWLVCGEIRFKKRREAGTAAFGRPGLGGTKGFGLDDNINNSQQAGIHRHILTMTIVE
ncbi:MAG: hypothetical protein ACYS4W_15090 [Planctomycetota bacterium]